MFEKNRLLIKALLTGVLIVVLLIPASLISNLVRERAARQEQVIQEVSAKWAGAQTIGGPVLIVPYNYSYEGSDQKTVTIRKVAHFLPESLQIDGKINPEERPRSLYKVMLYTGQVRLTGSFGALPLARLGLEPSQVLWDEARILIGMSDPGGLTQDVSLNWNGSTIAAEPGMPENGALRSGLSAPVSIGAGGVATFDIQINTRGTEYLRFLPLGKKTDVRLRSPWQHPSFDGKTLPTNKARGDSNGFEASWKVLSASRGFPQAWKDNEVNLGNSAFGVSLIQPVDGYVKTERSVKYAILFIALSFTIFFFLEILQKRRIHPVQYLLVGFALCIFYTLLLSITEYWGFNTAYAVATVATVALVGCYTGALFNSRKTGLGFSLALGGLYGYIFILIQLEDFALLFGSIGLFVILALLMYISRRIDWYGNSPEEQSYTPLAPAPLSPPAGPLVQKTEPPTPPAP